MKAIILLGISCILAGSLFAQPVNTPPNNRKVQVAILFDTSNSMDGLIDQAKSRIWNIVNEISSLKYNGQSPTLEFALYEYGNDGLDAKGNYIRQVLAMTSDLDDVSTELFALRTNGGSEYCGAVIDKSLEDLDWSANPTDLKMIYIAGNEAFDQGPVDYKTSCKKASDQTIYVNTIFCGNYDSGVQLKWEDGAKCSNGDYFNIDSDKAIVHIDTPFDEEIKVYNDSLNTTYFGYGIRGRTKKSMQIREDANASGQAMAVSAERTIAKSKKATYSNASWDLIDAVDEGKDLEKIEEEDLPEEFKGKTTEEKQKLLDEKRADRERYQKKIADLATERQQFIDEEMKRRAELGEEVDDFGTSVNASISEKALEIGFEKEDSSSNE